MTPSTENYSEVAYRRSVEKKTHVSFPQLKYPSLRDEGLFKGPVQWLRGKAMDDGAEGLWRVHNGLYDLNDFMKRHPGGEEWLELSKGTDITEAFETHHFDPSVQKLLAKFYVRNARTPRNSPFTFHEDGFYRSLKRAVREELTKIPKSVQKRADLVTDGLLVATLIASALSLCAKNYLIVMASYIAASLCLGWLTIAAHNYIHRRNNWRMYYFNVCLWSYRDFRVSHALSHHLFTNTLMDLEVSAIEPIVIWNPRRDVPLISKFAFITEFIIFPFTFIQHYIKRIISYFVRKDFFSKHARWHDLIGLFLPIWMYAVSGASFYNTIVMWLWINCTASLTFFTIGANAAHHHPKIFKDGDQVRSETLDWGVFQLLAVMDRIDINGNILRVLAFFGDHVLHHLFPTLDHAILPHLRPVFMEFVKKYKAKYHLSDALDVFIGQIKQTVKTEPTLLTDNE